MQDLLPPDVPVVSVSKGLEAGTGHMMSEIIPSALGRRQPCAFLSGPSFAKEVMTQCPTGVVAASKVLAPLSQPLINFPLGCLFPLWCPTEVVAASKVYFCVCGPGRARPCLGSHDAVPHRGRGCLQGACSLLTASHSLPPGLSAAKEVLTQYLCGASVGLRGRCCLPRYVLVVKKGPCLAKEFMAQNPKPAAP